MKKLITSIILIFSLQSAILADWERIDNINKSLPHINNIEKYDDGLIATSQNSIYKYDDESKSWILLNDNNFTNLDYYSFIYAKADTVIGYSRKNGTFLSTDAGTTWSQTSLFLGINGLSDFESNNNFSFALGATGISRSKKGEFKWEYLTISDEDDFISMSVKDSIIALSNITYTLMGGEETGGGIFISKDNGNTFAKYFELTSIKQIKITEDNTIIAMSESKLYKSTNYGENWEVKDIGSPTKFFEYLNKEIFVFTEENEIIKYDSDLNKLERYSQKNETLVKQLSCSQGKDNKLFIGTWSGVYELNTESMTIKLNSPTGSNTNLFYVNNIEDNIYYSGFDLGMNYTTDGGTSWTNFSNSLTKIDKSASRFARKGNLAIGSNYISYPLYTTNDLNDWDVISDNIFGVISNVGIIDNSYFITTNKGLFIKDDNGSSWGKSENLKNEKNYDVIITSVLDYQNTLFIGSDGDGVYKSTDLGKTWDKCKFDDELYDFSKIKQIYNFNDRVELIMKYIDNINYIYSYSFDENLWTKKGNLGKIEIKRSKLYGNSIFFTSSDGISYSNDYGKTVNLIIDGLDESDIPYINDFTFYNDYIYMVNSNGMYRRSLSDFGITSVESEIERNYLYTYPPYPNPAKAEVKVLFYWDINLPMTTDDISIYDITGKKIEVVGKISLVKQESQYGNIIWDCSSAQPGIYLINIKHGTEEKAVKVVVE